MDNKINIIKFNLETIQERIKTRAAECGRSADEIKLITVTKGQPLNVVESAIIAGAYRLGENYPLEAAEKIKSFAGYSKVEWHMIGHCQSRKASIVAENFDYFHSLDSLKLAVKLNEKLNFYQKIMPVLLELNLSGEESKFGWPVWNETKLQKLFCDIEEILKLDRLRISGLMTMPPYNPDNEKVRPFFKRMSELLGILTMKFPEVGWKELSMGTSVDFETAIQEGATFIRVGTAIVGPRDYQKKAER